MIGALAARPIIIPILALLAVNAYAEYNPKTPEIVQRTKPAVVLIEVFDDNEKPLGYATGWIAKTGTDHFNVVTNAHVVID